MISKSRYIKLMLFSALIAFSTTSCNKWLDVKPKTEIESDDLFSDENGFKEALAGVYSKMTMPSLYGRNLTFGLMDAMGQYWDIRATTHQYFDALVYNYESANLQPMISATWNDMYNAISNTNNIIESIDDKRDVFRYDNYAIIKGEAMALRAFLHFELLRMFAPADFTTETAYMPYVTSFDKKIKPRVSPKKVIELAIADLEGAAELLKVDPLYTGREVSTDDDNGYLLNRNFHMNYYAVKGLLARIHLYTGNKTKASEAAQEVINAHDQKGLFPWVNRDDVTNPQVNLRDRTFSSEHLFALNIKKLNDYISGYFRNGSSLLITKKRPADEIYENLPDYRTYFFETVESTPGVLTKLLQLDGTASASPKRDRMPMIRLSEMYYIAAECKRATPAQAVEVLNVVRRQRGIAGDLPGSLNEIDVQNEIYKEYVKEFIGEGQLFYYHKRRGDEYIFNIKARYVFPLPDSEAEYGK